MKDHQIIEFLAHLSIDTLLKVYRALERDKRTNILERDKLAKYYEANDMEPFFMVDEILVNEYNRIDKLMVALSYMFR